MKNKYKISLISISLMFVLSLCITTSYAFWMNSVSQTSTNVVTSDCFEITFRDYNHVDVLYAYVDGGTFNSGYLTLKTN